MRILRLVTVVSLGIGGALASLAAVAPQSAGIPQGRGAGAPLQGSGRANQPAPAPLVPTSVIVGRVVDAATGKPVAGATVTLSGGPARAAPPTSPTSPRGPVPPVLPPPPPPKLLTDGEGRFAFRGLTRGNYQIVADKPGYASGGYGRSRSGGPTRPVQLDDNERIPDLTIRVFKYAAITGLVTDERGDPIVNAQVRAYRRVLVAGRRVLSQSAQVQTNDRGVYRLFNLSPAEYLVSVPMQSTSSPGAAAGSAEARQNMSATSQNLNGPTILLAGGRQLSPDGRFFWQSGSDAALIPDATGRWRSYATTYYPGSATVAGAQPIVVASGEERTGVDVTMRFVPVSSVSGLLLGPAGPAANYVLRLLPGDSAEVVSEIEVATTVADGTGAFSFLAVPLGQYVIQTVRVPREPLNFAQYAAQPTGGFTVTVKPNTTAPPAEPLLWAMTTVNVGETDLRGIGLTLQEGLTISGRLEFSGMRPKPDAQRLSQIPLVVEPVNGRDNAQTSGPPSRVQPDGRFVTTPRIPGRYFLRVGGAPAGFIVQSITVNGVDATEAPFDLTQSLSNVVITFTDLIAGFTGTVRGTPAGADPPAVVLFPADSTAWKDFGVNPARMRMTRMNANGAFSFGSLISGDYYAIAIPEEFSAEWQDPAFLEVLSRAAQRFTLGHGEKRTLDLTLSDVRPPGIGRTLASNGGRTFRSGILGGADPLYVDDDAAPAQRGPFVDQTDQTPQVRDTRAAEPVGTGSISGVVTIDDGTNRPARLAKVSARGGGLIGERLALTDDEGRFTIAWLPPGDYQIQVTKSAYLSMYHGAKRPVLGPGAPIKIAAGQAVTGVNIGLQRGAVIEGFVLDPLGLPAPNVRLVVQQYTVRDGERILTAASQGVGQFMTDDRGAYRIYGLRPGKYVVSATPPTMGSNTELRQLSDGEMRAAIAEAARPAPLRPGPEVVRTIAPAPVGDLPAPPPGGLPVGYSPMFYPGTPRPAEAAEIAVSTGQELHDVTIQLQLVPTARVEGRVIGPDGQPATRASVTLARITGALSTTNTSVRLQEGVFQAVGVPVGRYILTASMELQPPQVQLAPGEPPLPSLPPKIFWAQQDLEVAGNDYTNIVLTLATPPHVSGRVVFDGGPPPEMRTVQVRLESAGWPQAMRTAQPTTPDANGTFTIIGVVPAKYRLSISVNSAASQPQAWSMLSGTVDGHDAIVTPFDVRADRPITSALITLTNQPAEVSGQLLDGNGQPVTTMTVVLFPTERTSWSMNATRVNRTTRPGADGVFRFTNALPGEYYLAVLTELDSTEWADPAFKEQVAAAGIKISIGKGEKKTQNMRIR